MENGTFTSKEDVPYALVLDLPGSGWVDGATLPGSYGTGPLLLQSRTGSPLTEDIWFVDAIYLWIQSLETQTLVGIGMVAITMITFLGAKCLSKNEEPVEEPVEVLEEPCVEEVRFRGIFSQIIAKVVHIFG